MPCENFYYGMRKSINPTIVHRMLCPTDVRTPERDGFRGSDVFVVLTVRGLSVDDVSVLVHVFFEAFLVCRHGA